MNYFKGSITAISITGLFAIGQCTMSSLTASHEAKVQMKKELDQVVTELFNSGADIPIMLDQSHVRKNNGNEYIIYPKEVDFSANEKCVKFTVQRNGDALIAYPAIGRFDSDNYNFKECFDRSPNLG